MGSIRLLLALAVALYHSYGLANYDDYMTGGTVSVQVFYIISGFYMAMILSEKYRPGKGSYRLFITNRFLRIFPPYWACLAIVLIICLVGKYFFNQPFYLWYWTSQWKNMHWTTVILLLLPNLLLFGSDWLLFSGMNRHTGRLELSSNAFYQYKPAAFQYLMIPQIWSVGVELTFYVLAPFILRAKWFFRLALLLLSLGLRYYLEHKHYFIYDPWTYRFFPNELAFFMAGSLAYDVYQRIHYRNISRYLKAAAWIVIAVVIVFYSRIHLFEENTQRWYFYVLFLLALPLIFMASKNSRIDRLIGELSFPVYISHHFIMFLWRKWFWAHTEHMQWFGIATVLSSLLFAFLLWRGLLVPLEKIRQRRFERKAALL